jgi:hypothetical protein
VLEVERMVWGESYHAYEDIFEETLLRWSDVCEPATHCKGMR